MPVRRDADGNIIDEQTRVTRLATPADAGGESAGGVSSGRREGDRSRPTDPRDGASTAPAKGLRDAGRYSAPTTPVRDRAGDRDGGRTRIYRPGRAEARAADEAAPTEQGAPAADDPMVDPPVGWLVVVDGPGRGRVATLGMGINSIGRDRTERVSLDYGDATISRTNHGAVAYDPRGRKFHVLPGGGTNLTYVDDEPVLAPRELEPSTLLQVGNTVLRFVALCGADFSWDDESERD